MTTPSGEQHQIHGGRYAAVVTQAGATLRSLTLDDRPLVDGFGEDEQAAGGRGQLLVPWPNRVRGGTWVFEGQQLQLPITEVGRGHASHGLVRWVAWSVLEREAHAVTLGYRLVSQPGYPWTLDLSVTYALGEDGLTVTQRATNCSPRPAPYASGAHPYLVAGPGPVDGWELHLDAATRSVTDEVKIPVGRADVAGTTYDFSTPRPVGDLELDDAFTDLARDNAGQVQVTVTDPATGRGTQLWGGPEVRWFQLYTADDQPATARRSLACEPMTADANALVTGQDLRILAAAGELDDSVSVTWGVRGIDQAP